MHFVFAITTFNRLKFLRECWKGFVQTRSDNKWTIIAADDGSTDGSLEFLESLPLDVLIYNRRCGIAEQTNSIFSILSQLDFDVCFKCDDDMLFLKRDWDIIYYKAILESGFDHLCYDNDDFNIGEWCKDHILPEPRAQGRLLARVRPMAVKGCFWTVTPRLLKTVGYMDSINFFHGYEHTDFTYRCCRAGFNDINGIFDVNGSQNYLGYRFPWDKSQPCLTSKQYENNGNSQKEVEHKKKLLLENRLYIPYTATTRKMT